MRDIDLQDLHRGNGVVGGRSASTSIHDPGSHLMSTSVDHREWDYSKSKQRVFNVTSHICTFLFLNVLFTFAVFNAILQWLKSLFVRLNRKETPTDPKSKAELKLIPDLNYYFRLYGLQVNTYDVTTDDGYVLTIQRIIDPQESAEDRAKRLPILCVHGLLQSSGSFCSSGKQSLAYYFHQQGYDVWLGNNRCGFEAKHTFLSPSDHKMWDWDIIDMAQKDLPALIEHVLISCDSQAESVTLVCHSQGTTQGFITLDSDKFGLSSKINCFVALSPAVFGGELLEKRLFIRFIAWMSLKKFFFGINSFIPFAMTMRKYIGTSKAYCQLSYMMFNYLFDWNDTLWDQDLKCRHFLFSPVYVSMKLMAWWLNSKEGFNQSKAILEPKKQWFDSTTPPIFLVIPTQDLLVDGRSLVGHMKSYEPECRYSYIYLENYSHLDVLWSKSVIDDVGVPIINFLESEVYK